MHTFIKNSVKACMKCQLSKIYKHTKSPISTFLLPDADFSPICIDFIGPLPISEGYQYCLNIIHRFTRWPEVIPTSDMSAETTCKALISTWIARFGCPSTITTDQGRNFESHLFREFTNLLDNHRIRTTAYRPQSKGIIEHFHLQLKNSIKSQENPRWTESLPLILLGIRSSVKDDIQATCSDLAYCTTLKLPSEILCSDQLSSPSPTLTYVYGLRSIMQSLIPIVTSKHCSEPIHIHPSLLSLSHVYLRIDSVKPPLQQPYSDDYGVQERQSLLSKLLDAVKQCQIRFGGRTELATENDSRVVCLCTQFEAVLQHGMRKVGKSFLPLRNLSTADIHWQICEVYGATAMSESKVHKWVRDFKAGCINVYDEFCSGRPSVITENMVASVEAKILENRRFTIFSEVSSLGHENSHYLLVIRAAASFYKEGIQNLVLRHVTGMMKGFNILNGDTDPVFWQMVRIILNKHDYERYMLLKNIHTDIGRGRAWLRSALNENSLERYMHMILADVSQIRNFYEDWAFLMDEERSSMLPMMAAGLGSILFAISIDNPDLNMLRPSSSESLSDSTKCSVLNDELEPKPVISKSHEQAAAKKKKKKKRPTSQVVSFDDDDLYNSVSRTLDIPESCSAPATCLSSPVQLAGNFHAFSSSSSSNLKFSGERGCDQDDTKAVVESYAVEDCIKLITQKESEYSVKRVVNAATSPLAISYGSVDSKDCNNISEKKMDSSQTLCALSDVSEAGLPEQTTLTPIGDSNVGELIPIVQNDDTVASDDSVSIPSFCEDVDNAVAALAIAQRIPSWSVSSNTSHGSEKSQPRSRSETLTMSADEMREALLCVMQKKEEFEEKSSALRCLLEREMEMAAGLRAELEDQKRNSEEKIERLELKIQTVTRENELLKHQLKKYIAAVQMLKHDSGKVHE
ncbi:Sorting nexin-29, partial [Stegodyphus mimosarum]